MFKLLRDNRAQAIMGEYLLVFFLVIGMIMAMSLYLRRSFQGRMHDARDTMVQIVRDRAGNAVNGTWYVEYEPYYMNTDSTVTRSSVVRDSLSGGGGFGIARKDYDDRTAVRTISETAPPKAAD
jgi:hypothetical protein